MPAPRLEIDLEKVHRNTRMLVQRLGARGISVTGVTKACLGNSETAKTFLDAGVNALGDSRVENIESLHQDGVTAEMQLIRSPMMSQVDRVVALCDISFNTEIHVIRELSSAARRAKRTHGVVLMVELGDLREGILPGDLETVARATLDFPNIALRGIGTNLACRSGVSPDVRNMAELSALADSTESATGHSFDIVSGGNSANLHWALGGSDTGRVNNLRLGESLLLGLDPLHRHPINGLHTDAITLVAEVIEVKSKPLKPWGVIAQSAFNTAAPTVAPVIASAIARAGTTGDAPSIDKGSFRQAILAIGRQDIDPAGLSPPADIDVLDASSDHLLLDVSRCSVQVGAEITFGLNYSALVRAMTSPFVTKVISKSVQP